MMIGFYLLLGLALIGALYWVLTQITARQRRLNAELTRLEGLVSEVTLNAEAVLDLVDQRVAYLNQMLPAVEKRTEEPAAAPAPEKPQAEESAASLSPEKRMQPPPSIEKYRELRSTVWALADRVSDPREIAARLGIPRGEVELMLQLRKKKGTTQSLDLEMR